MTNLVDFAILADTRPDVGMLLDDDVPNVPGLPAAFLGYPSQGLRGPTCILYVGEPVYSPVLCSPRP